MTLARELRRALPAALAAGALALPAAAQQTELRQLVLYGIDGQDCGAEADELIRYEFATNTYTVIGPLLIGNQTVCDCETFAFIPFGEHMGFYTVPNSDSNGPIQHKLLSVNPLTAEATIISSDPLDFGWVRGMVPYFDGLKWYLWVTASSGPTGRLVQIDPADGTGVEIISWTHQGDDNGQPANRIEGLAFDGAGTLWGMSTMRLWRMDVAAGTLTEVLVHEYNRTESLEVAYGDYGELIDLSGIFPGGYDPSWTADGVMFAFSDNRDLLLVVNPTLAEVVEYVPPPGTGAPNFPAIDAEGIIFLTESSEPYPHAFD